MLKSPQRATLVLAGLALAATLVQAAPSDPKKWSKVENTSRKTYILTNVDATGKTSVGTLWCKPSGTAGNGTAITKKNDKYDLTPGSHLFYFDTTLTRFGIHLNLQGPQNQESIGLHVTNLDPLVTGTQIKVSGDPVENCNIIIDPTGYRNLEGGTLFTIKSPGRSATSDK